MFQHYALSSHALTCALLITQLREKGSGEAACTIRIQVLPSFRQPTSQAIATSSDFSAAWSAFHLKRVIIMFVSSELLKCSSLKRLSDHPMNHGVFCELYPILFACLIAMLS